MHVLRWFAREFCRRLAHFPTTRQSFLFSSALTLAFIVPASRSFAQKTDPACDRLNQAALSGVSINAEVVAAGSFNGPPAAFSGEDLSGFYKTLPAFCRVQALARPSTDSEIKIEVWLPAAKWNGRLEGLGNGGFAGLIDYQNLGVAVSKGYVATATDTGHTGTPVDATWALGHPEKVVDFGHRGIHEMTRVAKELSHAYYGKPVKHAYFDGCSDGGREALMEAQRYPQDYDGILAGAPANYWTQLLSASVWNTQALTLDEASFIPPAKIPAIAAAVNATCDKLDAVQDGALNDPRQCHFDPASIQCKEGANSDSCLTTPQVAALRKLYQGPRDARGQQIFPGYLPGAEDGPGGWGVWITGPAPMKSLMAFFGVNYFSYMVYGKPDWDYRTFQIEPGLKAAVEKTATSLDAAEANLGPFKQRGGKLILYHGWQDPAIPALSSVRYYDAVRQQLGQSETDSFLRFYLAPGMQHCGGGPGPDAFGEAGDWSSSDAAHSLRLSLEEWVEKGKRPASVIATKFADPEKHGVKMTRPLCPYPQAAVFKGTGDPDQATNFVCKIEKQ